MRASDLPEVDGASHFFVRAAYRWGRGPTLADAIKAAQVRHLEVVHVCRVDDQAHVDEVNGCLLSYKRGDIWEGRVWGKNIILKRITHPMKNTAEGRSDGNL